MTKPTPPELATLIVGMLSARPELFAAAEAELSALYGPVDLRSPLIEFDFTDYYEREMGGGLKRKFVSFARKIDPGELAEIKHKTNKIEQTLAKQLNIPLPRPVNLDPGIIEPAKLVLATTKNYSHRIYIGKKMYAEVTLIFDKGTWQSLPYTYPDYKQPCYHDFFTKVRTRLLQQLRTEKRQPQREP